jgi:hypothetical protein
MNALRVINYQYLEMLKQVIVSCPEASWNAPG